MCRAGCPEEVIQQSNGPHGCVGDDENIVIAFIPPKTVPAGTNSIGHIPGKEWQKRNMSVYRASKGSYKTFWEKVVEPRKDAYIGYGVASAFDLRSIMAEDSKTLALTNIGVACIIDDSLKDNLAHALMGECKPKPDFWNHHNRLTARANVCKAFSQNGPHTKEIDGLFAADE